MSSLVEVEPYSLAVADQNANPAEVSDSRRETNLMQLAWRSRWLILMCMLVGAGIGWVALQRVVPRYMARSRIYVDRQMPQLLSNDPQIGQSVSYLYTQAELIRSTPVLAAVAEDSKVADIKSFREVDNRVAFLKDVITVTVGSKDDIIDVWAELADAQDAAQIVNACVDAYIRKYTDNQKATAKDVLDILHKEKERRERELDECTEALDAFRKNHTLLSISHNDQNVTIRRFADLSDKLTQTELDLLDAKSEYNQVKRMYDNPDERPYLLETASRELMGRRDVDLENQVRHVEQLLNTELAKWDVGHPQVQQLQKSHRNWQSRLKKQQEAIIVAFVEGLRQKAEGLEIKRKELSLAFNRQKQQAMEVSAQAVALDALQSKVKRAEGECDIINQRIQEVDISRDAGALNVDILEVAGPSSQPSYPIPTRFLASGLLAGGLMGFGLAWLRELLDHRLRSVDEIAAVLQLPVLGALPHSGDKQERSQAGRLVALAPRSPAAEAFRTLRTALHFGLAGKDAKVIVVTSPSPGDGKSTVASNLAIAMAQADQRVLLIDADLRKPKQHVVFEVAPTVGLGSVLTDRRPVEEAIISNVVESLDLLPCGPIPSNPVELLNNGFFKELLEKLRDRYDRIVIDSPPVMPVADARVIAALGEATLLVLRAERSTRRLAQAARNELWRVRATRIGVVVNGIPQRRRASYGGGYGYGYGYGDYGYMEYGYGEEDVEERRLAKKQKALLAKPAAEPVGTVIDSA
jgi:capsular exopolysaccharide synthesis family protein